jgi:hypothetical protein
VIVRTRHYDVDTLYYLRSVAGFDYAWWMVDEVYNGTGTRGEKRWSSSSSLGRKREDERATNGFVIFNQSRSFTHDSLFVPLGVIWLAGVGAVGWISGKIVRHPFDPPYKYRVTPTHSLLPRVVQDDVTRQNSNHITRWWMFQFGRTHQQLFCWWNFAITNAHTNDTAQKRRKVFWRKKLLTAQNHIFSPPNINVSIMSKPFKEEHPLGT